MRRAKPIKAFHQDKRGAVLAEFLIALMPLMITFSSFVQLTQIATARLVLKHTTVVAARAAAVMSNGNNNTPGMKNADKNEGELLMAVKAGLGPWDSTMENLSVKVDSDQSSGSDVYGMITVRVQADYHCAVPFGGFIVCRGRTRPMNLTASFPHQGACYQDLGGTSC